MPVFSIQIFGCLNEWIPNYLLILIIGAGSSSHLEGHKKLLGDMCMEKNYISMERQTTILAVVDMNYYVYPSISMYYKLYKLKCRSTCSKKCSKQGNF